MGVHKSIGRIKYDPRNERSTFRQWWCILLCDKEIIKYYQHIFYKLYWKKLNTAVWNSHISLIRGEEPINKDVWKQFDGRTFEFEYEYDGRFYSNVENGGKHFWIKANCDRFADIRKSLGLSEKPRVDYHISIGSL